MVFAVSDVLIFKEEEEEHVVLCSLSTFRVGVFEMDHEIGLTNESEADSMTRKTDVSSGHFFTFNSMVHPLDGDGAWNVAC